MMNSTEALNVDIPSPRQVKAVRSWLGMSQPEFAKKAGLSLSTIMDYEKEKRRTSTESLAAIGLYLKTLEVEFVAGAIVLPK